MLNIMLIDSQNLNRTTLKGLLERERGITVVAEAEDPEKALRKVRTADPDIIVIDGALDGMGPIELCNRLRRTVPASQTVVLGTRKSGPMVLRLLESGADGYLTRCSPFCVLIVAIRTVAKGERYVSPETARLLALAAANPSLSPLGKLTPREMAVMLMLSQGQRRQEISRNLCLSPKTVSTYRSRLMKKLGVRTDVELTHLSLEHGLLDT